MEKMLHLTPSHDSLPDSFVMPPDQLLPATSAVVSLPVVDMTGSHEEVRRAIMDAGKEIGFFQVINHGVPEQVMQDMVAMSKEFFQLPVADKANFYSEDKAKPNRLFSGTTYETGGEQYWMDCLRLACAVPIGNSTKDWPDKPQRLREVVEKYIAHTRALGMKVLQLLCEGMGLRPDYFAGDLSGGDVILTVNHYPACPNPNKALGLPPHRDRNLMTLVLPSPVRGLEVAYKGDWLMVDHVPDAFVVNFGSQLEILTNGMMKGIEHRVMTNSAQPRTSVVVSIEPTADCVVGPAEDFISEDNPPCYRALKFSDFKRIHGVVKLGSSLNLSTNIKNIQQEI